MSVWVDIHKRSSGDKERREDQIEISEKEQLVETLVYSVNQGCGDLAKILKSLKISFDINSTIKIEIKDDYHLSDEEIRLLQSSLILPFHLWTYKSLEEMLSELGVCVIIDPAEPERKIPSDLQATRSIWKKMVDENPDDLFARMMLEKVDAEIMNWQSMLVLGCYIRKKKQIKLFPNNMKKVDGGKSMNELLVSTLVHEAMHAYFDRVPLDASPYVYTVEEPMAEFGMLLYLKETNLTDYYTWAEKVVGSKRTCYRYGVALMKQCEREGKLSKTRNDLELYKVIWPLKSGASKPKTARAPYTDKQIANSIKAYLFDGMSFRDIEHIYLGMPKLTNGGGWAAKKLLESRGIGSSMKKMFDGKTASYAIGVSTNPLKSTLIWMEANL